MTQPHRNPQREAWEISFFDENHLNYATSPDLVASPAQLRFMVFLEPGQLYYPCSERVFREIMDRVKSPLLGELYNQVWTRIFELVEKKIDDPDRRAFLNELLHIKFEHETANYNIIPSRLEKRLFKLFMVTTQIEDPLREEKEAESRLAAALFESPDFVNEVNRPVEPGRPGPCSTGTSLESIRRHLDATKLRRLLMASVQTQLWRKGQPAPSAEEWRDIFNRPVSGDGWQALADFLLAPQSDISGHWMPRKIMYLADRAGEIVFDLGVIQSLLRLGHTVILAVKNAAFLDYVYLGDMVNDPLLSRYGQGSEIISSPKLTQNQLAASLRNDPPFKIITDGTMERLNLMRTSVTFARAFKEVDGVISKGPEQRRRFISSVFEFTQDIFCIERAPDGGLQVLLKARCPRAPRFTFQALQSKADAVISQMRQARKSGMTVMFYSGIVGSIPGETETAIKVMTTFIEDLQRQQSDTFIINPSSYFEPGMDADDLMYMWEIVQRSGLIDIWRFQTYQDVERSFALMKRRVPPQWVGKDATFSTGSTKERAIAADVQRRYPEMQIIGPDQEKFLRRGEYGIGMFHDTRLNELYEP